MKLMYCVFGTDFSQCKVIAYAAVLLVLLLLPFIHEIIETIEINTSSAIEWAQRNMECPMERISKSHANTTKSAT